MKLNIVSDLHLDFKENCVKIISGALDNVEDCDALVIAGDTCSELCRNEYLTKNIFKKLYDEYRYIIEIPGNHSYWGMDFLTNKSDFYKTKKEFKSDKHFYLNNDFVIIDGVKFIGSCLWSEIKPSDEFMVKRDMNDYNYIYGFTPSASNDIYNFSKDYLLEELSRVDDNKKIVITHHLPSFSLVSNEYIGYSVNCAYASNFDSIFENKIDLYIHGHCHKKIITEINNVPIVRNPFGYPGETLFKQVIVDV